MCGLVEVCVFVCMFESVIGSVGVWVDGCAHMLVNVLVDAYEDDKSVGHVGRV